MDRCEGKPPALTSVLLEVFCKYAVIGIFSFFSF